MSLFQVEKFSQNRTPVAKNPVAETATQDSELVRRKIKAHKMNVRLLEQHINFRNAKNEDFCENFFGTKCDKDLRAKESIENIERQIKILEMLL